MKADKTRIDKSSSRYYKYKKQALKSNYVLPVRGLTNV